MILSCLSPSSKPHHPPSPAVPLAALSKFKNCAGLITTGAQLVKYWRFLKTLLKLTVIHISCVKFIAIVGRSARISSFAPYPSPYTPQTPPLTRHPFYHSYYHLPLNSFQVLFLFVLSFFTLSQHSKRWSPKVTSTILDESQDAWTFILGKAQLNSMIRLFKDVLVPAVALKRQFAPHSRRLSRFFFSLYLWSAVGFETDPFRTTLRDWKMKNKKTKTIKSYHNKSGGARDFIVWAERAVGKLLAVIAFHSWQMAAWGVTFTNVEWVFYLLWKRWKEDLQGERERGSGRERINRTSMMKVEKLASWLRRTFQNLRSC